MQGINKVIEFLSIQQLNKPKHSMANQIVKYRNSAW